MGQRQYWTVDLATASEGRCTTDGEVLNPFETAGPLHQGPTGEAEDLGRQHSSPEIPQPNPSDRNDYPSDPIQVCHRVIKAFRSPHLQSGPSRSRTNLTAD